MSEQPALRPMDVWTDPARLDWRRTRLILGFTKDGKHFDYVTFAGHRFSTTPREFRAWIKCTGATGEPFRQQPPIIIPAKEVCHAGGQ